MARAQGSLEYMVIIAAVLAISAVTVLFLSGVLSGQSPQISVATCKQASQTCKLSQMSSPNDPCLSCASACQDAVTKKELFVGATYCCNHTMSDMIYAGSGECAALMCGNGQLDGGEECDAGSGSCSSSNCHSCLCTACNNGRLDVGEVCDGSFKGTCTGTGAYCSNCQCYCSDGTKAGQCSTAAIGGMRCSASGSLVLDSTCPCPTCYTFMPTLGCIYSPNCGTSCCLPPQSCSSCTAGGVKCCPSGQTCCGSSCCAGSCSSCGALGYSCCPSGYACKVCPTTPPTTLCCLPSQTCQYSVFSGTYCG